MPQLDTKMTNKRDIKITISLSLLEKEELLRMASQNHLKLSSYCRMKLFSSTNNHNIVSVPIVQLKNSINNKHHDPILEQSKNARSTFKSEVQDELIAKLKKPKPLKKIPKQVLYEIKQQQKIRMQETPSERKARWKLMNEQLEKLKIKNKIGGIKCQ
jgi:hypothetical protein